jgi:hypothetical protein
MQPALIAIVAMNLWVIGMIVATKVKRAINQSGSRPGGRSVTIHIHD